LATARYYKGVTMLRILAPLLALLTSWSAAAAANGQVTFKATVGWGNCVRLGRWTPVFLTVADPNARSVQLQLQATHGVGAAMSVGQTAVAQLTPTTYALLFPIDADPTHAIAILADDKTGATLFKPDGARANQLLEDPDSVRPAGKPPLRVLAADETLVGLSGNITDAALVQDQLTRAGLASGILALPSLPANSIGYESISVLTLAAADLRNLDGPQQHAIIDWIHRGGNLLIIPGTDPPPIDSILETSLPCRIADNRTLSLPPSAAATQPSQLNGRELIPRPGSTPIYPFGQPASATGWTAYTITLGMGRITVLPANISSLHFPDDASIIVFWRTILTGLAKVPNPRPVTEREVSIEQEDIIPVGPKQADSVGRGPRETFAVRHVLQVMDAASPHASKEWTHLLLLAAGICLLLGPFDSILLMYLGWPPRHWLTVLGWIGLIAAVAAWIAQKPRAQPLAVGTFRIVDQANGAPIAATDLLSVESNRDRKLSLSLNENEWWEPANQAALNFSRDRFVDIAFHEDLHGCRPRQLSLTAGQAQSLRGETSVAGAAILDADLAVHQDAAGTSRVTGTLSNRSPVAITDLQIATPAGNCRVSHSTLAAGDWIKIDEPLTPQPIAMTALPPDVLDVSSDRNQLDTAAIAHGSACVYCQMPDALPPPAFDGASPQNHWQILRALVPLTK
jgi:hypothetical protein